MSLLIYGTNFSGTLMFTENPIRDWSKKTVLNQEIPWYGIEVLQNILVHILKLACTCGGYILLQEEILPLNGFLKYKRFEETRHKF